MPDFCPVKQPSSRRSAAFCAWPTRLAASRLVTRLADTINVLWVLGCTAAVFLMQAGFCCLEAGMVRSKNSINVAIKNVVDLCVSARTDKHKVLHVPANLISNARNAMAEHDCTRRERTVSIAMDADPRPFVESRDTGIGISRENLEQIFNHGFTTRERGHGFGLHSSANTAAKLGGALTVASEGIGRGTVFTLRLSAKEDSVCTATP